MAALVSRQPLSALCRMRGSGDHPLRRSIAKEQAETGSAVGLRQTTLTQIDFITRVVPQDNDDLECIEAQQSTEPQGPVLPRKRRKVSAKKQLEQTSESRAGSGTLPPASTRTKSTGRSYSQVENIDNSHLTVSDASVPSVTQLVNQGDGASKANPKTPSRRQRTAVPSSQSPETTPLTLRTRDTDRSARTMSPLAQARERRIAQPKTPSGTRNGGIAIELSNNDGPAQATSFEKFTVPLSKAVDNQTIRSLRLQSPKRAATAEKAVGMRLEASPNAPAQYTPRQRRGRQDGSMGPPTNTTLSRIPSSQASTQDPTQITASMAHKLRPTDGATGNSQVVTQETSQVSDSMAALPANYSRVARDLGEEDAGRDYTALPYDESLTRVPSSQATTVEPSSDMMTPVSRQSLLGSRRPGVRRGTVKNEPGSDVAKMAFEAEEARDLTDSQLISNSLLNWTIPFPPPLSSQDSLASIPDDDIENRGQGDELHVPILEKDSSHRPGPKVVDHTTKTHSTTDIKEEKVSEDELQVIKERAVKRAGAGNARRRVKNEPID